MSEVTPKRKRKASKIHFKSIIEGRKAFKKMEGFAIKTFFITSKSFHDYLLGLRCKRRIIISLLIKMASVLTLIRFGISLVFKSPYILWLTSNANHILGNYFIISAILFCGTLLCDMFLGVFLIYNFEFRRNLFLIEFLFEMNRNLENELSIRLAKKFRKQMKYLSIFTSYPLLWAFSGGSTLIFCSPPFIAYFLMDSWHEYSLLISIFWTIIQIIRLFDFYAIIFNAFNLYYLSVTHIKYRFMEIDEEISSCTKTKNYSNLLRSIKRHNEVCISTEKLNNELKYIIFIMYKLTKPALNLCIYGMMASDFPILTRLCCLMIFVMLFILMFLLNMVCASVSSVAKKPLKTLHKCLLNLRMSTKMRLEVMSFVEKLSQSEIGFTCLDVFPMNNNEFYEYVSDWGFSYMLFIDLIRNSDIIS